MDIWRFESIIASNFYLGSTDAYHQHLAGGIDDSNIY